jgi:hypothetical protein
MLPPAAIFRLIICLNIILGKKPQQNAQRSKETHIKSQLCASVIALLVCLHSQSRTLAEIKFD